MEENGGFQTQFTAVMESVLQAAVGEATKLFERTLHQLKAELVHLRQENADLKTGLFARQFKTRHAGDGPQRSDPAPGPPRCDTGVQCEKPLMVERCCSPAQFGEHPLQLQHITSDRLADLCSSASEDGNRQLALLLIKKEPQETECDDYAPGYFLLKQEGAEPILVRKEPFKNTMEKVMIPSTFQTVSRCYGNPKEISIANTISTTTLTSTSNSVSCSHRVDTSNNKVTQTTSTSTFRGLTPPSDKDRQKTSTSTKKLTLPQQPANSSQSSVPAVSSSAPTVSLSLSSKVGQMPTPRTHPTASAVSVQMIRPLGPRANLNTSQPQQLVKNIQHPATGTYLNPQPVRLPLPQRQNLVTDSCSSTQSLQAPVANANRRVLPASVDQTVTPLAQSSTQPRRPSLPPFESVIPQVQKMTPVGNVSGPRVQASFSPDQHTVMPGQVPKPLSQIPPPPNHVANPSIHGPIPSVHGPIPPVKGPMPPIQGPVPPIRGPLPAVQSKVLPMQGPAPLVQIPLPPVQGLLPPIQGSVPPIPGSRPLVQGPVPSVQSPVSSVHGPVPPVHSPVSSVCGSIPPVQSLLSSVRGPVPPVQSPVSSVHGPVPSLQSPVSSVHGPVLPRSNEMLPPNSQSLTQQAHFPPVPCHDGTTSTRPHYPQTQIPFAKSYIPVQSMKSSVSPVPISQANAPSPLEQIPVTTSHYQILSDPLCSSSDQFFSPPDNTSDLLQALPPMPFQSPIVLTQQEAALEQPSMIHLQSSGQPLQLAPLLTLKEQQLAASNQGSVFKRGPAIPGETMLSGVSNFEEHIQRFLTCSSSTISCEGKDSITNEVHNKNSSENDQDRSTALMPGVREHYKVLSKPESNSSSRIHSQSSGQPLQLAPPLTQTEQQVVASNQGNVSKGEPAIPGEIMVPAVNNFEEHMQRFLPCSSPTISCEGNESITNEMHNGESSENDQDGHIAFMPGVREQYKVLSKPESNLRMLDSTKEQQTFRMNAVKDLHINSEVAEQNQTGCDAAGLVWESTDSSSAFPHSALSASAPNRGRTLQKASRRVLERNTECSECGRILSNASSLENHMRLHRGERPYNCSQCGKAFPSVRGLNRHVKVHAEEKGYKCEECGRCFVYQFTLTKHKLIHSGDRPYPCKICGKKFLAKADRSTHMRMHTGEKPFFCSQCGKTFKHRVALNMHLQGHKGEKRYVCPHCEKGFVDLGNFKRHKRIHTGEKPFECKDCGKRFTQSAHLKKHVNTQHAVPKIKLP